MVRIVVIMKRETKHEPFKMTSFYLLSSEEIKLRLLLFSFWFNQACSIFPFIFCNILGGGSVSSLLNFVTKMHAISSQCHLGCSRLFHNSIIDIGKSLSSVGIRCNYAQSIIKNSIFNDLTSVGISCNYTVTKYN